MNKTIIDHEDIEDNNSEEFEQRQETSWTNKAGAVTPNSNKTNSNADTSGNADTSADTRGLPN